MRAAIATRLLAMSLLLATSLLVACGQSEAGAAYSDKQRIEQQDLSRLDVSATSGRVFGKLDNFELVDQTGRKLVRADLTGSPFAMAFIFTTCTGPCPLISSNMVQLQSQLEGSDIRLVSLSVDPEQDTPEVLANYAREVGADTRRWTLLTGSTEIIDHLIKKCMYLMVDRQVPSDDFPIGMHVSHSTKLVAFDRHCQIRGYYSGVTEEGLQAILARLRFLEFEDS